ncbi:MAG: hypothetical protein LBM02_08950, partial [Lachnospiraceae bacterium]|nr:hypothetical protein [Lachnospiraceae bacterium]
TDAEVINFSFPANDGDEIVKFLSDEDTYFNSLKDDLVVNDTDIQISVSPKEETKVDEEKSNSSNEEKLNGSNEDNNYISDATISKEQKSQNKTSKAKGGPGINWISRTADTAGSVAMYSQGDFMKLNWDDLMSIKLDSTNIWNSTIRMDGEDVPYGTWTYRGGKWANVYRFHGDFEIPVNFDPTNFLTYQNINPDTNSGYNMAVDNDMFAFIYPWIDQNNDGVSDLQDGDLSNDEITNNNFMSYCSFYIASSGISNFNGFQTITNYGGSQATFGWAVPNDNAGTIITSTRAAYPDLPLTKWVIDLYAMDFGAVGGFPKGNLVEKPSGSSNVITINYYYDTINPSHRIGYETKKGLSTGNYSLSSTDLNKYLNTANSLGGGGYSNGIQTGENPITITQDKNSYVINVLYAKNGSLKPITVKYRQKLIDNGNLKANNILAPDTTGYLTDGKIPDDTTFILNENKTQAVPVKKDIEYYNYLNYNYDSDKGIMVMEYSEQTRSIKYNVPKGVASIASTVFNDVDLIGGNVQVEKPAQNENYEFNGWYTDKELTQKYENDTLPVDSQFEDLNLYGDFSSELNIINPYPENIIGATDKVIINSADLINGKIELKDFIQQGVYDDDHTFLGYFTGPDGTGDKVESIDSIGNKTIYAHWLPNTIHDSDGDGVPDGYEEDDGTDKNDINSYKDTDGDKVPDFIENDENHEEGNTDFEDKMSYKDKDGDKVPDYVEKRLEGTHYGNPDYYMDTDGDEVPDYVEENLEETDLNNIHKYKDTDRDEVPDYVEEREGSSIDGKEDFVDTDGDGVPDYVERREGTDANDKESFLDSDKGGIADYLERMRGTNPFDKSDDFPSAETDNSNNSNNLQNVNKSVEKTTVIKTISKVVSPLTSDSANIALWLTIIAISMVVIEYFRKRKYK